MDTLSSLVASLPDFIQPPAFLDTASQGLPWRERQRHVAALLQLLNVTQGELLTHVSNLPRPPEADDESWREPRRLSKQQLSNWIKRKEKMPVYRAAGVLALLEVLLHSYETKYSRGDDPGGLVRRRLDLARAHLRVLGRDQEVKPLLLQYRALLNTALKHEAAPRN